MGRFVAKNQNPIIPAASSANYSQFAFGLLASSVLFLSCQTASAAEFLNACGQSQQAQALAKLVLTHSDQRREMLVCDPVLAAVAAQKSQEMAEKGRVSHGGKGGPNRRIRVGGFLLPRYYPKVLANQVESVGGGPNSAQAMWLSFLNSSSHRLHLLGEAPLFSLQNRIGVGYFYDPKSPHVHYWTVYIAEQRTSPAQVYPFSHTILAQKSDDAGNLESSKPASPASR